MAPFRQEIRFARTSDGLRIAYAVSGRGYPLVRCTHWLTSIEYPRPFQIDPSIQPTFITPNQPAYPSGHSCIEGATSRVLEYLFPRDAAAIRSRAEELAMSRWWARIHWTWDNEQGLRLGRDVADKVIAWAKADGAQ